MVSTPAAAPALEMSVDLERRPIAASLGVLGRRWTLLLLRDLDFRGATRCSDLRRLGPGISPRVLSNRLKELSEDGCISRVCDKAPSEVHWQLTAKGRARRSILIALIEFGIAHHADEVFEDGR